MQKGAVLIYNTAAGRRLELKLGFDPSRAVLSVCFMQCVSVAAAVASGFVAVCVNWLGVVRAASSETSQQARREENR
jgi:hypothetical protein